MAIFIAAIATAHRLGAMPKPLVYKPLSEGTNYLGVTKTMNDEPTKQDKPQAAAQTGPYAFLYELDKLDHSTGVLTQTELGARLDKVEGVIRGAAKAISKVVPMERLKEDGKGKLTALGVALVTACVNREDTTLEAWVHGLMEAMKSPEFKKVSGEKTTADDIDLSFMDEQIAAKEAQSSALALSGDNQLKALARVNSQLDQQLKGLANKELDASFQEGFQTEMDRLTEFFKGKMAAKKAFLKAQAELGDTPDF